MPFGLCKTLDREIWVISERENLLETVHREGVVWGTARETSPSFLVENMGLTSCNCCTSWKPSRQRGGGSGNSKWNKPSFLVQNACWHLPIVARYLCLCSSTIWTIPRCRLVKILLENGLFKKDLSSGSILLCSEKCFLDKFVKKYQYDVAGLTDSYFRTTYILEPILGSKTWKEPKTVCMVV